MVQRFALMSKAMLPPYALCFALGFCGPAACGETPSVGSEAGVDVVVSPRDGPSSEAPEKDRGTADEGVGAFCPSDELAPWAGGAAYYAKWDNGPPADESFFPIAVWLQNPMTQAEAYKAIGINLFIGLWKGPTEEQLSALATAQLSVIADQNAVGLSSSHGEQIWAWMHQDEPDNAQAREGGGYDPCVERTVIQAGYTEMVKKDPTRPVYLNFGRGVAHEDWGGRGVCTGHLEHYPEYIKGADIISFDIYPVTSDEPVSGKLWYVPRGVERLREYAAYKKPVWTWIETTHVNNAERRPTPAQVRTEVWMALIHGAMGIGYFAHEFAPAFKEAGLLAHAEIADAVKIINAQIESLAPVLNSPAIANGVAVTTSSSDVEVATMVKRYAGATYLFAVAMRDQSTTATFDLTCVPPDSTVVVLGEERELTLEGRGFSDVFEGYAVHLYRIDH